MVHGRAAGGGGAGVAAQRPARPHASARDALSAPLGRRRYPDGIVRHLDRIGLLGPRLTLAHCTWARPDELELIAERGATIAVNTSSNLGLRSGIAPLAEMVRCGCRVALGLDGLALDEDDDALREMRLAHLIHAGSGFRIDVDRAAMLEIAFVNGRRSVLNRDDGGTLAAGAARRPAAARLGGRRRRPPARRSRSARSPVRPHHRAAHPRGHRRRPPDRAGRPRRRHRSAGDARRAAARLRAAMAPSSGLSAALRELERSIEMHFESEPPCC